jgi:hypothetical protein
LDAGRIMTPDTPGAGLDWNKEAISRLLYSKRH